jgi:hypothetical protein
VGELEMETGNTESLLGVCGGREKDGLNQDQRVF